MKFRHPVLAHGLSALRVAAAGWSAGVLLAFVAAPIVALLAAQSVMGSGSRHRRYAGRSRRSAGGRKHGGPDASSERVKRFPYRFNV